MTTTPSWLSSLDCRVESGKMTTSRSLGSGPFTPAMYTLVWPVICPVLASLLHSLLPVNRTALQFNRESELKAFVIQLICRAAKPEAGPEPEVSVGSLTLPSADMEMPSMAHNAIVQIVEPRAFIVSYSRYLRAHRSFSFNNSTEIESTALYIRRSRLVYVTPVAMATRVALSRRVSLSANQIRDNCRTL